MKLITLTSMLFILTHQFVLAQTCKTTADLETVPGKYQTAAEYPWPAVRAAYFTNLTVAADKTIAKQTLAQIEKNEAQSHSGFSLTGGNWENVYSTEGYGYAGNTKLGQYTFQSALYEYFCANGKSVRNSEYSTVLRIYVNAVVLNTLNRFLSTPFGSSMNGNDFGFQFLDWKNHKPADVNAQLISLFTYISCNSQPLLDAINSGNNYFQDVPEKEIKPNNRSNNIYRYWFVKKNDKPVLVPVSRKEYLQSLLEYYEREKLQIPMQIKEYSSSAKQYANWQADVSDKIAVVKKALTENKEEWLSKQAVINYTEDKAQNYKAKLTESTNYNRFWKFYDNENKGEPLYKYNPDYFKPTGQGTAKPQIITVAFRYVTMPSSLRMLNNFTKNFDFTALKKMVE